MKMAIRKIILLGLFLFHNCGARAQWQQVNGPYGGLVGSLANDGTHLYAGTNGGGVF
jgi:hypothetical protein